MTFLSEVILFWGILIIFSPMSGYSLAKTADYHNPGQSPVFDNDFTIREVEAVEGQTLLLPCTVRSLGDKVVSWIRSKDLHILTSGRFTFSGDNRFEPVASPDEDFYGLRIRGVLLSDKGQYECQVNTDPKMSLGFYLTVSKYRHLDRLETNFVGQALIKGPREVYVRDGSPVTFTCEISLLSSQSTTSFMTTKVRWLHDNKELLQPHPNVFTQTFYKEKSHQFQGVLHITKASGRDSGQYSCFQMSVKPSAVNLVVVEREHSEPMQRDFPAVSGAGSRYFEGMGWVGIVLMYFPT